MCVIIIVINVQGCTRFQRFLHNYSATAPLNLSIVTPVWYENVFDASHLRRSEFNCNNTHGPRPRIAQHSARPNTRTYLYVRTHVVRHWSVFTCPSTITNRVIAIRRFPSRAPREKSVRDVHMEPARVRSYGLATRTPRNSARKPYWGDPV